MSAEHVDVVRGVVYRTVHIEGWISRDVNLFRHLKEWRASIKIGDQLQWQWCPNEKKARAWVKAHTPKDMVPESGPPRDTPYDLFETPEGLRLQRVDEQSQEGDTDDTAALTFVRDLERGDSPHATRIARKLLGLQT